MHLFMKSTYLKSILLLFPLSSLFSVNVEQDGCKWLAQMYFINSQFGTTNFSQIICYVDISKVFQALML